MKINGTIKTKTNKRAIRRTSKIREMREGRAKKPLPLHRNEEGELAQRKRQRRAPKQIGDSVKSYE